MIRVLLSACLFSGCAAISDRPKDVCESVFSPDGLVLRYERRGPFVFEGGDGPDMVISELKYAERFEPFSGVHVPSAMPQSLRETTGIELYKVLKAFDERQRRACEVRALFPADDLRNREWARIEGAHLFMIRLLLSPITWETGSVTKIGRQNIPSIEDVLAGKARMHELMPAMILGLQRFQMN